MLGEFPAKETIDIEEYEKLVEQIHAENPKLDIEICKYIAGSYLYDIKKNEKPDDKIIKTTIEIEA